jgi:hypothetical protein
MSASAAKIGKGTTVAHSTTSGGSYTTLLEVTKVGSPKQSVKDVDVTHYVSDSGVKEYIPGWIEPGTVEYEANYLKAQETILQGLLGVAHFYKIQLPDGSNSTSGSTFAFPGYIKELGDEIPNEDKINRKITIKVSGPVVFTAGT